MQTTLITAPGRPFGISGVFIMRHCLHSLENCEDLSKSGYIGLPWSVQNVKIFHNSCSTLPCSAIEVWRVGGSGQGVVGLKMKRGVVKAMSKILYFVLEYDYDYICILYLIQRVTLQFIISYTVYEYIQVHTCTCTVLTNNFSTSCNYRRSQM